MAITNAIIQVGNNIVKTLAPGDSPSKEKDHLSDIIAQLREILLPGVGEKIEDQAKRAARILDAEHKKGPIALRPMAKPKRKPTLKRR